MLTPLPLLAWLLFFIPPNPVPKPKMYFGDTTRTGRPFAKDPHVVAFGGRYLMYFSVPPAPGATDGRRGWGIGIAESRDLTTWKKVGELTPAPGTEYEKNGLCAPGALVRDGRVHLFYQTYGNGRLDAICHAVSADGLTFARNPTNPIFRPTGAWNCGRAIDAEVVRFKNRYLLFFATRDPAYKLQLLGVAAAPLNAEFNRGDWQHLSADGPILKPELPWEGECVEGASVTARGDELVMFYAGAYNNWPQQIGVARSRDGLRWERLGTEPFLKNGQPGDWNRSESGHPHVFTTPNDRSYLFFQGNDDGGKTWFLSNIPLRWAGSEPALVP